MRVKCLSKVTTSKQRCPNMEKREIWNLSGNTSIPLGFYSARQSAATANRMRFAIAAACHAGSIIFHSTNILQHIPLSSVILVKLFSRCIAPIRLLIYWAIVCFIWFNIETISSSNRPVASLQTWDVGAVLVYCWSSVVDDGSTVNQRWANVPCLQGCSCFDREVDIQGLNCESSIWRAVSSHSSHHPQEVLLAQFSLYVHKSGLKPDSFYFISCSDHCLGINTFSYPCRTGHANYCVIISHHMEAGIQAAPINWGFYQVDYTRRRVWRPEWMRLWLSAGAKSLDVGQ